MAQIIASCGISCHECPAFLATEHDDDDERAEVAERWSKEFDAELSPKDINCAGCLSDAPPHFSHCTVCEIRKCARAKRVANCAHCDEYVCETLEAFFKMVPACRESLDGIRAGI